MRWASWRGYRFLQPIRPLDDGHGPIRRSALWALTDQPRSHLLDDVKERQCLKAALLPPRWKQASSLFSQDGFPDSRPAAAVASARPPRHSKLHGHQQQRYLGGISVGSVCVRG
jgi:hypothetical protein